MHKPLKPLLVILLVVSLAILIAVQFRAPTGFIIAQAPGSLNSCNAITASGTYILTSDIVEASAFNCIRILTSNVIVDCKDRLVDGQSGSKGAAFYVSNVSNVEIRNCFITDWANGIQLISAGNFTANGNHFESNKAAISSAQSTGRFTNSFLTDIRANISYAGDYDISVAALPSLPNGWKSVHKNALQITNNSAGSITLEIKYDESANYDESSLRLYKHNGVDWVTNLGTFSSVNEVDTTNNIVKAKLDNNGGVFAVLSGTTTGGPISPDNVAPSVSYTAQTPANNSTVSGSFTIGASVSDNVGVTSCKLYFDSIPRDLPVSGNGCSATDSAANGVHSFYITAKDAAGNSNSTETRIITVQNIVGADTVITFVSPTPAQGFANSTSVIVNASVSDADGVASCVLDFDGAVIVMQKAGTSTNAICTATVSGVTEGQHNFAVTANDNLGNSLTSPRRLLSVDLTLPAVSFTDPTPSNGTIVNGTVVMNATATDANLLSIELFDGNVSKFSCNSAICSYNWSTSAETAGNHIWKAVATDRAGNSNSSFVTLLVGGAIAITDVDVKMVSRTTALLSWKTSLATNSSVKYGNIFGSRTVFDTKYTTEHNTSFFSLEPDTSYFFNITSCAQTGGCANHYSNFTASTDTGLGGTTIGANIFDFSTDTQTFTIPAGGTLELEFQGKVYEVFLVKIAGTTAQFEFGDVKFALSIGASKEIDADIDGTSDVKLTLLQVLTGSAVVKVSKSDLQIVQQRQTTGRAAQQTPDIRAPLVTVEEKAEMPKEARTAAIFIAVLSIILALTLVLIKRVRGQKKSSSSAGSDYYHWQHYPR